MNATSMRQEFESLLESKVRPHERSVWRRWFAKNPERTLALLQAAP